MCVLTVLFKRYLVIKVCFFLHLGHLILLLGNFENCSISDKFPQKNQKYDKIISDLYTFIGNGFGTLWTSYKNYFLGYSKGAHTGLAIETISGLVSLR